MARTAGGRATPRHPGEILREDYIPRLPDPNQAALARRLGISRPRLNELLHRKRSVTPDTALRLARYFRTGAEFWLYAQADWDLSRALRSAHRRRALEGIQPWDASLGPPDRARGLSERIGEASAERRHAAVG